MLHLRSRAGASAFGSNVTDSVAMDGTSAGAVTMDVPDLAAAQAMLASPDQEMAAAAQRHGVIPTITGQVER